MAKPCSPAAKAERAVSWAPPQLTDPLKIQVEANNWQRVYQLDPGRDYVIEMPKEPVTRGLAFVGGHNVVLIGGEIAVPWQGLFPDIVSRTGLRLKSATGTVHIEGLLIRGSDLSEGIQIDAPEAVIQLQNVGVFNIHARDQLNFSDNHPDLIQTYGNVRELKIDRFTGSTDYQGFFFVASFNGPHGPVVLRRVNLIGNMTARKLLWLQPKAGSGLLTLDEVYLDTGGMDNRELDAAVWPAGRSAYPEQLQAASAGFGKETVTWSKDLALNIKGYALSSRPPGGDFVIPEEIGTAYCRVSYRDKDVSLANSAE